MNFIEIVKVDLDSPRRELSNGGLGIVVALSIFRELIFRMRALGVQSSCSSRPEYVSSTAVTSIPVVN